MVIFPRTFIYIYIYAYIVYYCLNAYIEEPVLAVD